MATLGRKNAENLDFVFILDGFQILQQGTFYYPDFTVVRQFSFLLLLLIVIFLVETGFINNISPKKIYFTLDCFCSFRRLVPRVLDWGLEGSIWYLTERPGEMIRPD